MTTITLPLTEAQTISIVVTADAFGVEPWEMAVHVLDFKRSAEFCGTESGARMEQRDD